MPALPRQIRLAAGDYFMHGQDQRLRQFGLPGNVCHAVMRLAPGLDVERLRQRVASSPMLNWLGRVRIVRPLPVGPPLWRATTDPRTPLHEYTCSSVNGEASLLPPSVLEHELYAGRGPALVLSLVRHPDATSEVVLSWNHALLDARGVDLLMRHLAEGGTGNGTLSEENLLHPNQRGWDLVGWLDHVMKAHGSVQWLNASGAEPLYSLVPPGPRAGSCRNVYRLLSFTDEETARIGARCESLNAAFRRSHFYLAASVRAVHTIATARGNKDGAYLVPVPHDTRRRGGNGPIFSNHLSILFYRIEASQAGRISDIMGELGRQMTEQIRTRFPECCMAALDMFKPMPLGWYVRHLGKPTRGKFASFCFSDSGEICPGMTELLGTKIRDVMHFVPSWRPPGLTILFLSYAGRLSALLAWVDDCLSTAEVDVVERTLRHALLAETP